MTLKALYLQTGSYNALDDRMLAGMLLDYSSDPLSGVGKIFSGFAVSAQATPNMTVSVSPGRAVCPTPASDGGGYAVMNDATLTVNVSPVSTLPRVDLVLLSVDDGDYLGTLYAPKITVLAGTPAASPVPPAQPAGSLLLATLNLLANATSVVNSAIARNLWNTHEAEYYASALQTLPITTDRPLGFPVVATSCPDVTPLTSTIGATPFGAFRINRDGVWNVEAGVRYTGITDGQSSGLYIGLDNTAAFRFAEQFNDPGSQAGPQTTGGCFNIGASASCIRRFGSGTVFCAYGYISGPAVRNTDPIGQSCHIRLTWLRN